MWAQTRFKKRFPTFSSVFKVFLISRNPPGHSVSMLKIWNVLFYSVFSMELPENNTGTMTFLLKAEKWYLNVLLIILCQPNAKEVIDFLCNTVNKFVGKHFILQKQTIHICFSTPSKRGQLAILCTTCTSLDFLWFIFFFQGKSKENLALISHNSQWDPMVMKLWPWKTSLELKR